MPSHKSSNAPYKSVAAPNRGIGLTSRQQAKTRQTQGLTPTEFAAAEFGIKAKQPLAEIREPLQFAAAEFGIKAKQERIEGVVSRKFAAAEFGIKAKLVTLVRSKSAKFAAAEFGIKAKPTKPAEPRRN